MAIGQHSAPSSITGAHAIIAVAKGASVKTRRAKAATLVRRFISQAEYSLSCVGWRCDSNHIIQSGWGLASSQEGHMDSKAIDPVCGMEVNTGDDLEQVVFQGRRYFFCSEPCAEQFEANPTRYLGQTGKTA